MILPHLLRLPDTLRNCQSVIDGTAQHAPLAMKVAAGARAICEPPSKAIDGLHLWWPDILEASLSDKPVLV